MNHKNEALKEVYKMEDNVFHKLDYWDVPIIRRFHIMFSGANGTKQTKELIEKVLSGKR